MLLAAFAVYAGSGSRLEGPADKAVQLVTLVPAALLFAASLRGERRVLGPRLGLPGELRVAGGPAVQLAPGAGKLLLEGRPGLLPGARDLVHLLLREERLRGGGGRAALGEL